MRRLLYAVLGVTVGLVAGGGAVLLAGATPSTSTSSTSTSRPEASTTPSTSPSTTEAASSPSILLVWTPGGLPAGFADHLEELAGVSTVSVVSTDLVALTETREGKGVVVDSPEEDLVIPVEVSALDEAFAELAPAEWHSQLSSLTEGEALLTETSATVRRFGVGAALMMGGREWRVTAVLPDIVLGGAEVAVSAGASQAIGVTTERYALVDFTGDRTEFEGWVRDLLPADLPVRIRAPGETPFLRNGDAVLPQVMIKEAFGEFAIRWEGGSEFEIAPNWVAANLVTEEVPLIGNTTCHAAMMPSLHGAMTELEQANLNFLVASYHGCFNPRFIAGTHSLSRHAWGVAVDINYTANVTGQTTTQDARLVETMERWGFTWGGNWLIPDAAHFEWVAPPTP
ncbi:MAG: M15 family metallopeptidase [Acidimicrobiia bacterium]|nr:M15 family metallopeptidase [Acidimicrobiia bacterium]